MIVALQTKRIDGCSCFPPIDSVAEARGTGKVIIDAAKDLPELKGVTFSTVYSTESVLKTDPATVSSFIRALTRAANLLASDPDAAKQATRPFFKDVSDEIFDDSWSKLLPILPRSLEIERSGWDKELAMEKAVLPASSYSDVPYDNVVDMSFVKQAREQLRN
jgi:ABC-type nitrate/sulfonate/bicarbonate transport system substrate-binding protein